MKEAEQNQKTGRAEVYFKMRDGNLYRYCRNFEGREISQIVIPKGLRETVTTMAHDAVMSGQGLKGLELLLFVAYSYMAYLFDDGA